MCGRSHDQAVMNIHAVSLATEDTAAAAVSQYVQGEHLLPNPGHGQQDPLGPQLRPGALDTASQRTAEPDRPELLARLANPQVQVVSKVSHAARLLPARASEESLLTSADRPQHAASGMGMRFATPIAAGRGYEGNCFQRPSETTSTVPSATLMAVWSSMAYAGPAIPAAHLSASAM